MAKKKKALTVDPSTVPKQAPKIAFRYDLLTLREKPFSDAYIEQLAIDMLEWATNDDDALVLQEFYNLKGICSRDIDNFGTRWPGILEARQRTKDIIAVRREKGGLKRKYDSSMIQNTMPIYSAEYKELMEWKAMLAAKAKENQEDVGPKFIVIEKFPSSDLVPERKKES